MSEQPDVAYLIDHSSEAHKKLKAHLEAQSEPFEEYPLLGDVRVDFYCIDRQQYYFILDEEHDHTDSYHLEKELQEAAEDANCDLLFLDAGQVERGDFESWMEEE